ncbi:MAG: PepSY-like domain-containing protein [Lentisphaeraceae bacterium]|nr:PepSY-like domain-containing protein [Lentisphaeraceae bacterium]
MLKNSIQLILTLLLLSFTAFADEGDEKISFKSLPESVQKSFKKIPHEKIIEVEKESRKDKVVYEIEFEFDGKEMEATFDDSGKLLKLEQDDDDDDK